MQPVLLVDMAAIGSEFQLCREDIIMRIHLLLAVVPAAMMTYGSVCAFAWGDAPATSIEGSSPLWTALQATKSYPVPHHRRGSQEPMEGSVLVRFHVGTDGHPQNIDILQGAHFAALDDQTRRSIQQATCLDCAGQDYLVTFRYRQD
jgi:TonB family protein